VKVTVNITKGFKVAAKPLFKKYPSLTTDLLKLEKQLIEDPHFGTPLGNNAYKIRLKISSKGKGKSGGARIITLVEKTVIGVAHIVEDEIHVNLLTIYDKSEVENISDKELKDLIKGK
jgi:mRNA-degrading endonuclease RelE of RelBE toxin-antitoxin system